MTRLVLRRTALLVPTLLGLSILLFLWVRALPGGPATALLGERATPEAVDRINALYGFDRPVLQQYTGYLGQLLQGNFGVSTRTGRPVLDEFLARFPATIELTILALVIAVGVGIPLGYLAARRQGSLVDSGTVVVSLLGVTIPVFFLAFLLKWLFAVQLGWFPSAGRQDPTMVATHPTGFYVLDGLLTRELDASWDAVMHLVLPALALGSIPLAIITRITRSSVLEVQGADYVRTARAKGVRPLRLVMRHGLRNALIPIVTVVGLYFGTLIGNSVLTEIVFNRPGLGKLILGALNSRDYTLLQGLMVVFAACVILVNLLTDLIYGLVDPRVKYQ